MATTYDSALPTNKDKVRALIPDTGTNTPGNAYYLTDEQIGLMLQLAGQDLREATAQCCETIATDLAKKAKSQTVSAGSSFSLSVDQGPRYFMERAKQIRAAAKVEPFYDASPFDYAVDKYGNNYNGG